MTESEQPDQFEEALPASGLSTLMLAREYWANARAIGEPGSPSMLEAPELQQQHAQMAETAALLSIAESLYRMARDAAAERRKTASAAGSLDTLAKEITKLRYMVRR